MHSQRGFGLIGLLLAVIILGLIGWGAFTLYAGNSERAAQEGQQAEQQAKELSDDNASRNEALERATKLKDTQE